MLSFRGLALCSQLLLVLADTTTMVVTVTNTQDHLTETRPAATLTFDDTTLIVPASRTTFQATTETYTTTFTEVIPPSWAARPTGNVDALIYGDIENIAPSLTTVNPTALSKLVADLSSIEYASITSRPTILDKALEDLEAVIPNQQTDGMILETPRIWKLLSPWLDDKYKAEVSTILAPWPPLQSEIMEYLSVFATYGAPIILAEATAIQNDLSLTTGLNTAFLARVSSYLPASTTNGFTLATVTSTANNTASAANSGSTMSAPSTSSSAAAAATTGKVQVLVNAGIAAAGMGLLALL